MVTYNTGTSNYPDNYDLFPTGTEAATVSYVLDQLRDPTTGIISQSGTRILAEQVNSGYTIMQRVQETIGLNPEGVYTSLSDRLNFLEYSGVLAFVPLSGGSMFGDLTMNSAAINVDELNTSALNWTATNGLTLGASGTVDINNSGNINISTNQNYSTNISSNSINIQSLNTNLTSSGTINITGNTINLQSDSEVTTHNDFVPNDSGVTNLGSSSNYFGTLYVDNIRTTGGSINADFLKKSGDTITGDTTLGSGVSLLVGASGSNVFGSLSSPIGSLYSKNIYATNVSGMSPVTFQSQISLGSGLAIVPQESGTSDLGDVNYPFGNIYVDNLVGNFNLPEYVKKSGSSMHGDLTMSSGSSIVVNSGSSVILNSGSTIVPDSSGTVNIGTPTNRLSGVHTDAINGRAVGNVVFSEILDDTGDPSGQIFQFDHTPLGIGAMVFVSGVLQRPVFDYQIAGDILTLTGTWVSAPGANTVTAGFYLY